MTLLHRIGLWLALEMAVMAQVEPGTIWTAYNDQYVGANRAKYTTAWNFFGTSVGGAASTGRLMDSATGQSLPVVLTVSYADPAGLFMNSMAPKKGSPADLLFGDHVDWTGTYEGSMPLMVNAGSFSYVFSKLDTNKLYRFSGCSVLGGDFASSPGWSLIAMTGVESYEARHSTGKAIYTNGLAGSQVAFNIGQNAEPGDYVSWVNIKPTAKGTITIRCTRYAGRPPGDANGQFGYGLVAIRFQECIPANTPAYFVEHPTDQSVMELKSATFHGLALGDPWPAYQWYCNDSSIPGATNNSYTLDYAAITDHQNRYYLVANNTVSNVMCSATSQVAGLTVTLDTNAPTLYRVLPPPKAAISSLISIEVLFDKPVTGVNASDLLVNGQAATNLIQAGHEQYVFEFPQPQVGTVQVRWSDTQGIRDASSSSNRFLGGNWTYNLTTNLLDFISITEFMAANKHGIRDEDGDYSDWIELHNSGYTAVPLGGCYLTTDAANPYQWQFPPFVLEPGGYAMVWASGKNRTNSTLPLHANFKLEKQGAYLALLGPKGQVVSEFSPAYPAQQTDVSYGRDRTDSALLGFFTTPTPSAPNATSGPNFGPDVVFSRENGTFVEPFKLRLSTSLTNVVIRYAFGTNIPSETSPVYTTPITVSNSIQIRARSYVPGLFPGDIRSRDYICLDTSTTNMTSFRSTLPILVIHNHGGGSVPLGENSGGYAQFAMLQVFEPKNGYSALTNIPDAAVQATIHRRGQTSQMNPKANLRVETIDEYGEGKSISLLDFPSDNDWVLYGIDNYDKVLMHNPLAHQLYRQMGRYSVRTRFVEVYLKDDSGQPGALKATDYNGLYVLEEKIKIGPDRVAIDRLQPENTNAPSITGGYLFSVDKDGPAPGFWVAGSSMWFLNPDGPAMDTPQREPQKNYLVNYLNEFYNALSGANWKDPVKGYAAYIDVPAWIDFHLHQVLMFSADMLRISTYWCKPRNGKMTPASLWDFDRAFGTRTDDDQRGFNPWRWRAGAMDGGTDPFNAANVYSNPWYGKMFTDPDFWQRWIDRYQELRMSTYSFSNVTALIERLAGEVAEATPREYARWTGQGASDTSPHRGTVSGDGWTYTFPIPGSWAGETQFIKTWFTNRLTFMDTNFLARPVGSLPGGAVPLGAEITIRPADKSGSYLVYTLDGTDPRLAGGGRSSIALSNLGPVTIVVTNPMQICARSWNPNHRNLTGANNPPITSSWSGPLSLVYYQSNTPSLRITEIMYHPLPSADGTVEAEEFEYVELTNVGEKELGLAGYRFIAGIDFAFTVTNAVTRLAPGQQVLVVGNLSAFASRYPGLTQAVAGEFAGHLNNGGDRLVLAGPYGETVEDITYSQNWKPITDGLGFSLVAADLTASSDNWGAPESWRTSAGLGGSPGAADPAAAVVSPVLINEVLSAPSMGDEDAIELHNPNSIAVDIGYWWLTDALNNPTKYLIPPGTVMPASGFLVLRKSSSFGAGGLNALNATNIAFGLQARGEQIYLFSGDAKGSLTGYYHGFKYGASMSGVTCGLYTNSIGQTKAVALSASTLNAPNASPMVGPVVISELMPDPPALMDGGVASSNGRDEYVELHNITDQPVPLYDVNHPQNTWRLDGGIQFVFPAGQVLSPQGYLLVVSFNPQADLDSLQAFRNRYGLTDAISIFGPYTGRLNSAGDEVSLERTGGPNADLINPPHVLADSVNYGVAAPWPSEVSGTGLSLQRRADGLYGDDPANWQSAVPTPGFEHAASSVALSAALTGENITISWPEAAGPWQMESADAVAPQARWQPVAVVPVLQNGQWQAIVPISSQANRFYRLKKP